MKRLTLPTLLSLGLLFGAIGCVDQAKTSADAPKNTQEQPKPLDNEEAKKTQEDAQSQVRRDQLNSDIRAREQRNNVANNGSGVNRYDSDLASQVRSKLEANLPSSALVVDSKEGVVTVSGTVPTPEQLAKIEPLAKEIKGVNSVQVKAEVVKAQPKENKQSNNNQNATTLVASKLLYNDVAQSTTTPKKPNSSGTGTMGGTGTTGGTGTMDGTGTTDGTGTMDGSAGSGSSGGTGTSGDNGGTAGGAMDNSGSTGSGNGSSGNGGSGGSGSGSGGSGGGGK